MVTTSHSHLYRCRSLKIRINNKNTTYNLMKNKTNMIQPSSSPFSHFYSVPPNTWLRIACDLIYRWRLDGNATLTPFRFCVLTTVQVYCCFLSVACSSLCATGYILWHNVRLIDIQTVSKLEQREPTSSGVLVFNKTYKRQFIDRYIQPHLKVLKLHEVSQGSQIRYQNTAQRLITACTNIL